MRLALPVERGPTMDAPTGCLLQPEAACAGCALHDRLKCRFKRADLLHFMALAFGYMLPAGIGLILGGQIAALLGWIAFMLFFFNVWEIRILCSHCPYYAEPGRTLRCIANYGSLKLWRYHPEPMSRSERRQLYAGFVLFGGLPFPFLLAGGQLVLALLAGWGLLVFFFTLKKTICPTCVNFSCPLNGVPKVTVDAYLRRNPTMRAAWEQHGYRLDE